jgi:hypothetical protein
MLAIMRRARVTALMTVFGLAWMAPLQAFAQLLPPLPLPGGRLIVAITSPASGATVGDTTAVSASVSIVGSLTVSSVQFQLDGANLGARYSSAPYSVSWNTTTAGNGPHTLTAVARDLLGVQFTSAPVTVTVFNAPPPPPPPPPPGDTTPPTVSITSPSDGATVRGTIKVTASASDNVGVVGVQFFGDGTALGNEVTAAPYSILVDTTTSPDGSHTLTAIARDAANNRTTSTPVTVMVANNTPPPPPPPPAPGSATRFEDTDPSVAYTAGWAPDPHPSLSGGSAAVSDTPGAQATFTFTGPSVSWIGGRSFETGIARVSLDGTFVTEVDTYSKTVEVQVPMFTAVDLTNTRHTLTIEATGRKNAAAALAFIIVDAFDVPAATISRLQETDPSVIYTGDWVQGDTSRQWSAGIAAFSKTPGARATFAFTGTGIRWVGFRGPQTGIARVSLDGVVFPPVNTYSSTEQIQAELFKKTGLADTTHTLTIEVTGDQDAASTSPLVVVDAFEVTTSGARHQETDPAIIYGGNWVQGNQDKAYSEGTTAETVVAGAQATFTFTGTGVSWIGFSGPQTGIADVFLDGAFAKEVDMYAPTEGPQHAVFTATGLAPGTHTLKVVVTGLKNTASSWFWVLIDAFDVIP